MSDNYCIRSRNLKNLYFSKNRATLPLFIGLPVDIISTQQFPTNPITIPTISNNKRNQLYLRNNNYCNKFRTQN